MDAILEKITLFTKQIKQYKITLFKPWIRTNWGFRYATWKDEWFIDLGILQIRKNNVS